MATEPVNPVLPDVFTGEGSFESWAKLFSACAAANGWDDAKKLVYLPTRLRGRAFRVFEHLPDQDKATFPALVKALTLRLASAGQRAVSAAQFRSRGHQPTEALDVYAYDLVDLFGQAYPEMPLQVGDPMIRDQFIVGLQSKLRDKVLAADPATFEKALEIASRLTSIGQLSATTGTPIPCAAVGNTSEATTQPTDDPIAALTSSVAELRATMNSFIESQSHPQEHGQSFPRGNTGRRPPRCFQCGGTGHLARSCANADQRAPLRSDNRTFVKRGNQGN
ncbi:hypothetical protein ISCGN_029541 [Ixodes scapularis]